VQLLSVCLRVSVTGWAITDMLDRRRQAALVTSTFPSAATSPPVGTPILSSMATQLDNALAGASLSDPERRTVQRFVAMLSKELGDDLHALWLYGSRARGEQPHPESDVDLLLIAAGDYERNRDAAMDLSAEAAEAEGESPFTYSVHTYSPEWLRGRREIESFFIQEVDRDKVVLAGSALEGGEAP
jgi:predicted nucleotidyltransferase